MGLAFKGLNPFGIGSRRPSAVEDGVKRLVSLPVGVGLRSVSQSGSLVDSKSLLSREPAQRRRPIEGSLP